LKNTQEHEKDERVIKRAVYALPFPLNNTSMVFK